MGTRPVCTRQIGVRIPKGPRTEARRVGGGAGRFGSWVVLWEEAGLQSLPAVFDSPTTRGLFVGRRQRRNATRKGHRALCGSTPRTTAARRREHMEGTAKVANWARTPGASVIPCGVRFIYPLPKTALSANGRRPGSHPGNGGFNSPQRHQLRIGQSARPPDFQSGNPGSSPGAETTPPVIGRRPGLRSQASEVRVLSGVLHFARGASWESWNRNARPTRRYGISPAATSRRTDRVDTPRCIAATQRSTRGSRATAMRLTMVVSCSSCAGIDTTGSPQVQVRQWLIGRM